MAAFLSRNVDAVLKRGNRRAALNQFWTTQGAINLGLTTIGASPGPDLVQSDGLDVWATSANNNSVSRVRLDGKLMETWTGAGKAFAVAAAMSRIFVTGDAVPGLLYEIDPTQPAGAVTTVSSLLGDGPAAITFDGGRIWTANEGGSVSIVTPTAALPWIVTSVSGFMQPEGIL
jgi:hypothetical protein